MTEKTQASEQVPAGAAREGATPGGNPPPEPPDGYIPKQLFEARLKAHDFVQEHLKQIIVIGSAVIAVTVTFLKDIVGTKGEQLSVTWLLPAFWVLIGISIFVAVYAIAIHINNLDKPNEAKPEKSFAAGANNDSRLLVLATILLFGSGMLALGLFAAINYRVFINRGAHDYRVSSAFQAVEAARKALDPSFKVVQLDKVELTKGVDESLAGTPTWNVQFEVKKPQPASEQVAATAPASITCSDGCRHQCRCEKKSAEPAGTQFNCLIEARTGSLLAIIESDKGKQ